FGVGIVGGETSSSPAAAVAVTLTGTVSPSRILRRSGGKPGDKIFVTGKLGGSLRGKHLDFVPRLAEGQWLGASGLASAMMDLSDGLAADLPRLAEASGCGFVIDPALVPRNRGCTTESAIADGEDYELVFTVPSRKEASLQRRWRIRFPRVPLTAIGHLTRAGGVASALPAGFDHFFHCQPGPERAS
nr:thiamine-phosphate kinase [Terrimicrobiaceae bacterium]